MELVSDSKGKQQQQQQQEEEKQMMMGTTPTEEEETCLAMERMEQQFARVVSLESASSSSSSLFHSPITRSQTSSMEKKKKDKVLSSSSSSYSSYSSFSFNDDKPMVRKLMLEKELEMEKGTTTAMSPGNLETNASLSQRSFRSIMLDASNVNALDPLNFGKPSDVLDVKLPLKTTATAAALEDEELIVSSVIPPSSVGPKQQPLWGEHDDRLALKKTTLIVYPKECLQHLTGDHQENLNRLLTLCGPKGILRHPRFSTDKVEWIESSFSNYWSSGGKETTEDAGQSNLIRPIEDADVLRVHDFEYYFHLKKVCSALPKQEKKMVDEISSSSFYSSNDDHLLGRLDSDSVLSEKSLFAAQIAAGAVCLAIDKVVQGDNKNAFVAIRPPGHHAGPRGCVPQPGFHRRPGMCSCGFCLLNNVAIGAAYAMSKYGPEYSISESRPCISRVAIIDFDIHHGNGTEEILRNLIPHDVDYPLPESWPPMQYKSYKPWKGKQDLDNVFFCSIHLFDEEEFYPGSGCGPNGVSIELENHKNILNIGLDMIGPKYLNERERLSVKARKELMIEASSTFRSKLLNRLLPSLEKFNPDLILISAGFDGHADDFYHYLSEDDYEWITNRLQQIANSCASGRLVSVLEGGYNIEAQKPVRNYRGRNNSNGGTGTSNFLLAAELNSRPIRPMEASFGSLPRSCAAHLDALIG